MRKSLRLPRAPWRVVNRLSAAAGSSPGPEAGALGLVLPSPEPGPAPGWCRRRPEGPRAQTSNAGLRPKVSVFLENPGCSPRAFLLGHWPASFLGPQTGPERLSLTCLKRLAPSPSAVTSLSYSLRGFDHHLKLCYYRSGYFLLSAPLVKLSCIRVEGFYNLFCGFTLRAWRPGSA